MRFGTGPVFAYERVAAARRWYLYASRSLLVAALLGAMAIIAWNRAVSRPGISTAEFAKLGESYFYALIGVEMAIVMLAAPAATAGAICLDRSRGNLAHMLVTDLSDAEIVLGKLAARLLPVLGLVACSWPVMAISSLLGGIDPVALALAFAVILASALFGCTMALALSVWARKTHEVVMATYTVLGLLVLSYLFWSGLARSGAIPRPPAWLLNANPVYMAYVPYWFPGTTTWIEYAYFFGGSLGLSAAMALLAVWRMRPRTVHEMGRGSAVPGMGWLGRIVRVFPSPPLDRNPVLWREWHRSRPSPWMVLLVAGVLGSTTICCITGAVAMFRDGVQPQPATIAKYAGVYGYMLQVIFGLLMFSAIAPMALAEERQRGSLDVLMTTPLSTRTIVLGKWWGTYRFIPLLTFGPALMAFAMAFGPFEAGGWLFRPERHGAAELFHGFLLMVVTLLAHGALLTSLGLALATWIPRQSRAIALSVTAYVLIAIAWPILYFIAVGSPRPGAHFPACFSPIWVAGTLADYLSIRMSLDGFLWAATFCDAIVSIAAVALLAATVRTFDRCLGRMPEHIAPDASRPVKKPPIYEAELIGEWETG
jgi:ABC-type transport system involved in multi-copper enzyme maturation permease subunit